MNRQSSKPPFKCHCHIVIAVTFSECRGGNCGGIRPDYTPLTLFGLAGRGEGSVAKPYFDCPCFLNFFFRGIFNQTFPVFFVMFTVLTFI